MQSTADNPKIRICRQPDLKRKLPENKKLSAPDANGNSVSFADIVTVKDGRFAGRTGTVKFVVRGSVFIKSRSVTPPPRSHTFQIAVALKVGGSMTCLAHRGIGRSRVVITRIFLLAMVATTFI